MASGRQRTYGRASTLSTLEGCNTLCAVGSNLVTMGNLLFGTNASGGVDDDSDLTDRRVPSTGTSAPTRLIILADGEENVANDRGVRSDVQMIFEDELEACCQKGKIVLPETTHERLGLIREEVEMRLAVLELGLDSALDFQKAIPDGDGKVLGTDGRIVDLRHEETRMREGKRQIDASDAQRP